VISNIFCGSATGGGAPPFSQPETNIINNTACANFIILLSIIVSSWIRTVVNRLQHLPVLKELLNKAPCVIY
jgi:hypothetical protein